MTTPSYRFRYSKHPSGVSRTLADAGIPRAGRHSVWGDEVGFQVVKSKTGADVWVTGTDQEATIARVVAVLTEAGYHVRTHTGHVSVRWDTA